ncbi:glutamate racemase [Cronobacter turicensis]|uniref:glutamate racemase n=1 Tax=Cronobacter turicensis TaxID=413502 RepID=UPI0024C46CA8|nr:glutamate racemase [Cronobacter turicensis]MDK1186248.1 glutamate racemase [Cronobacter turicensis]MDK1206501.1 glutamate racemase [Cronobacter turicensis]MDK1214156.1 glutamate racemase [Cronobacter turicensis]MDK1220569.1 glutamate racemase [Cronobacter turicensis]MDK1230351.1 glutamate racemase [Cronobacter turicensis]
MATLLQDGSTTCQAATPSEARPTILVFDSGVGGLSVYDEIRHLLPDLHYIYAFDNVAFPYGEKSEAFIVERVVEIVTAVQARYPLALAVIACNSASTVSLPALREKFAFPVVGVVPAIKPAARLTANGVVGLLATRGTVKRPYTHELIARFANECQIEMLGSAELVEIAEANLHGEPVSLEALRRVLRPWLRMPEPPDTVVLGCTHFPLLADELLQVLPEGTRLVDSGAAIARRTAWLLEHEAPDACSFDENIAYCMALTPEVAQLMSVLQRYGFNKLEKLPV